MKNQILILSACIFAACSNAQTTAQEVTSSEATASVVDSVTPTRAQQSGQWDFISEESVIGFSALQTGTEFSGSFKVFSADIVFDPDNLEAASVSVDIDMSSFDAGSKDRNGALPGKDWFFIKKFPSAQFTSNEFVSLGENNYEARGELNLRGINLPLTLPFTLDINEGRADMTGQVSIDRGEFGVGQGAWATDEWVSLKVDIEVKIAATQS